MLLIHFRRLTASQEEHLTNPWSMFGLQAAKGLSRRMVPSRFGMNLIKQMEIVTSRRCVWHCGSLAQWSEFWHGMREVLGSNHRSDHILFPHHFAAQCGSMCGQRAANKLSGDSYIVILKGELSKVKKFSGLILYFT